MGTHCPTDDSGVLAQVSRLPLLLSRLSASSTVGALFANAARIALEDYGFERAIVATVEAGAVGASHSDALQDAESDRLRRRLRARPVALVPETYEAELIRLGGGSATPDGTLECPLAAELRLSHYVLAPIPSDARPLALLVLDRTSPQVTSTQRAGVLAFAAMLGVALESVIIRARHAELSGALRQLSSDTQALIQEHLHAQTALPLERLSGRAFPRVGPAPLDYSGGALNEILSPRELEVARRLALGRSNRQIGEDLFLSAETVKGHVGRILRKLNVQNRVEASTRIRDLAAVA